MCSRKCWFVSFFYFFFMHLPLRLLWLIEHLRCHQWTYSHITIFLTRYPNLFNNLTTGLDMASLYITDRSKTLEHCCRHDFHILFLIIYVPEYNWVGWLIPYSDISLSTVEEEEATFFLLTTAPLVIKSSAPSLDLASSLIGKISEVTNCLFSSSLFPHYCLICLVCFKE